MSRRTGVGPVIRFAHPLHYAVARSALRQRLPAAGAAALYGSPGRRVPAALSLMLACGRMMRSGRHGIHDIILVPCVLHVLLLASSLAIGASSCRRLREDAARGVYYRRNQLRSRVRVRRRIRRHHRQHLRGDARLRLPRAAREARAAHAGGDARRRGRRPDLHDEGQEGHFLHARPGVQGQAARAHRGRLRLRLEAHPRSGGASRRGSGCSKARSSAATRRGRRRRRRASSTTTRRSPGLEVVDRYTLRIRLK